MSRRQDIIAELRARLEDVTVANGYQTDAGALLFINQTPALSEGDPEQALALLVLDDAPGYQGEHVVLTLPVEVHAVVRVNVDDPIAMTEAAISDIKKAIETDHALASLLTPRGLERGVTSAAKREQQSEYSAGVVRYTLHFKELWGNP